MNWQPGMTIELIEKEAIQQAMRFYGGNKTQTARALDISIRTLDSKLEKYADDNAKQRDRDAEERRRNGEWLDRQRGLGISAFEPGAGSAIRARKEDGSEDVEISESSYESAESRMDLQPTKEARSQHEMSMPLRKEIQGVPPKHAAGSRHGKSR